MRGVTEARKNKCQSKAEEVTKGPKLKNIKEGKRSLEQGFQVPVGLVAEADRYASFSAGLTYKRVESGGAGSGEGHEVEPR